MSLVEIDPNGIRIEYIDAWTRHGVAMWQQQKIRIGFAPGHGWIITRVAQLGSGTWLATSEESAYARARLWMHDTGGTWIPCPACYDADGPDDGKPWVRVGSTWILAEGPRRPPG